MARTKGPGIWSETDQAAVLISVRKTAQFTQNLKCSDQNFQQHTLHHIP